MAGTFDTVRAARRLKDAGASEPVAEAIAEILRESRDFDLSQLATKTDLEQLRLATKSKPIWSSCASPAKPISRS